MDFESAHNYCEIRRVQMPATYNTRRMNEAPIPNLELPPEIDAADDQTAGNDDNQFEFVATAANVSLHANADASAPIMSNMAEVSINSFAENSASESGSAPEIAFDPLASNRREDASVKNEIELNDDDFLLMINNWETVNNAVEFGQPVELNNNYDIDSDGEGFVGQINCGNLPAPITDNLPDGYLKREHDPFSGDLPYADTAVRKLIRTNVRI